MRFPDTAMEPEIVEGDWWEVEFRGETNVFPVEHFSIADVERAIGYKRALTKAGVLDDSITYELKQRHGFGARLSMPGYLDCTDWCVLDTEKEARDYLLEMYGEEEDIVRCVSFAGGYLLLVWDTHQLIYNKNRLGYRLHHPDGHVLFEAEDYGCAPGDAIDSDASLRGLLCFLTLKPGDTDDEYFAHYSEEQLRWAQDEAEALFPWTIELDGEEPPAPFVDVECPF